MVFSTLLLLSPPGTGAAFLPVAVASGLRAAAAQARLEELFSAWEKARRETRTLVVEFTLEQRDQTFGGTERFQGSLKLRRTADGGVQARYELTPARRGGLPFVALLRDDRVYWLQQDKKVALLFDLSGKDGPLWLKKYFNPFVLLIDRARARQEWRLQIAKQDGWYTYLDVRPRGAKRNDPFDVGRVALLNRGNDAVPRNFPRRLWYTLDVGISNTYDITRWSLNGPDKLADEDFADPGMMLDWKVLKWPPRFDLRAGK
jgi:hypothetical protein